MSEFKASSDGTDTYIARSEEDLKSVIQEHIGGNSSDHPDYDLFSEIVDTDMRLEIRPDPDSLDSLKMTISRWIKKNGRGFLCSTEF